MTGVSQGDGELTRVNASSTSIIPDARHLSSMRLRVKPEHGPFRVNDKKVRIGGTSFGIAAEIEDPTGSVWTLLESLDGECNVEQVIEKVLRVHPSESRAAALRAIETFFQAGYIEDLTMPDPDELSERDKERYDRSRSYFRWADLTPRLSAWEPQVLLRRASVTVIGVGGTGGSAALALAMSGVGHVHCVDCDDVELSNLNRQVLFTEADIGQPKWMAAVARLRQHNSDIIITGEHCEVASVEDVKKLSRNCDVLVLCADQPSDIRAWTNRACLATGTSWVEAGYHGPQISFSVFTPGEGACWECLRITSHERYIAMGANFEDTYALRAKAVANAVAAPTAGLGGYLAAHGAISLITGVGRPPAGRIYSALNLVALDHKFVIDYPRRDDCPACGSSELS